MSIANFTSKSSLNNDNSIMFDSTEEKNKDFTSTARMNSQNQNLTLDAFSQK